MDQGLPLVVISSLRNYKLDAISEGLPLLCRLAFMRLPRSVLLDRGCGRNQNTGTLAWHLQDVAVTVAAQGPRDGQDLGSLAPALEVCVRWDLGQNDKFVPPIETFRGLSAVILVSKLEDRG